MPSLFGWKARFDVDASHVFPQVMPAPITLVGGGAGDRVARVGTDFGAGLPLCSVAVTILLGAGQIPSCWSRSPEGQV